MKGQFLLITLCSLIFVQSGQGQTKDFSGHWAINVTLSKFGDVPKETAAPQYLQAKIEDHSITVQRTIDGKSQIETLVFGAEDKITYPDDRTLRKANVKFIKDEFSILFSMNYEVDGKEREYYRTEKWNLSKDGKELKILRITILPDKVDKVLAIYERTTK